jgi:peptidyl-prolyl cis-trans isomerase C
MLAYLAAIPCKMKEFHLNSLRLSVLGLCAAFLLGGCSSQRSDEVRPLVRINDRQIVKADFDAAFGKTIKSGQLLSAEERQELERDFLTQLVDHELILAEARRRGLAIPPAQLTAAVEELRRGYPPGAFEAMLQERGLTLAEWQTELTQNLMLDKLVDQVVGERSRISEQAIDAYYAEHRAEFDRPAQVRARQIVVAEQAEGEQILANLRRGEAFAEAAQRHSLSPEGAEGGDLGFFGRDEMPPEFEAVFALPVGKPSPLIKSDYGYHLFLVEAKRPAAQLSRQEAAAEIRARLEAELREAIYQEWLQELRGKAVIEVDWRQLEVRQ